MRQLGTKVIGITGTNGKTTTKELISAVLSKSHNVLYTEGNLNNHIGVPMTLLRLKAEHELAVIEMGANHPGDKISGTHCRAGLWNYHQCGRKRIWKDSVPSKE